MRIALRDLGDVYGGEVDVEAEFIAGQFRQLFNAARRPEGSVYFAGEHLSVHHTWIVGALDSALLACQQLLGDPQLAPLRPRAAEPLVPHDYDYAACAVAPAQPRAQRGPLQPAGPARPRRWHFSR